MNDKAVLQEGQYAFPYHHLPHFEPTGVPMRSRRVGWGLEYLCYQRHVAQRVAETRPGSVLEVGCGDGRFIGDLDVPGCERYGIDISEPAIAFARRFHPEVSFEVADSIGMPIRRLHDTVASIEVLEHIPDAHEPAFVASLFAATRVGGHVVLSTPTTNVPLNRKHFRHYDAARLVSALDASGASYRIVSLEYVVRTRPMHAWFVRLTSNRYWFVDWRWLNAIVWRRMWSNRIADARTGAHLVVVATRTA
jgi:2-polyprenyl-3-methyl-5-hydroxy-6-metoxy-1,4-benzoquinol methylase